MSYTSSKNQISHALPDPFDFRCPSVGAASPCNIVSGDPKASYPSCCPRVECPQEAENEISTREDQLMMASSNPRRIATYDVTLDTEDDQVKIVTELANFHSVVIFCELKGIYNFFFVA